MRATLMSFLLLNILSVSAGKDDGYRYLDRKFYSDTSTKLLSLLGDLLRRERPVIPSIHDRTYLTINQPYDPTYYEGRIKNAPYTHRKRQDDPRQEDFLRREKDDPTDYGPPLGAGG